MEQPHFSRWSGDSAWHCRRLNRRHTAFDSWFSLMNIWALLPGWKTCSSVVALTGFLRGRSFTSPMKKPERGKDFLTRAVKHLWLPPLSGCVRLIPPGGKLSLLVVILYEAPDNRAERSWNAGQCALCVFRVYHVRSITAENYQATITHICVKLPNYHTVKRLFVLASRCICVAWVNSLLHLCFSHFHCKQEMSGSKEQIVIV